ncbi:MAG TPA: DUF2334 domain-containing protein [Myxococcota bacterium]|nr:DUF2334 domain-containing protein [Myxococcota bacterium]
MSTGQTCLTVEIHDVSPASYQEARTIRAALAEAGIEKPSLLVVPNFEDEGHVRWDLRRYPECAGWLRGLQGSGCEIIQHGYTHRAPAPPPPGLANAFMHHVFSRGCAEFAHLTGSQAAKRLEAGRLVFSECGLDARGFVAPAWQQSSSAIEAVRRAGFGFTAFFNHVLPLSGDRHPIRSPALTFDAPGALVDYGKRALMRLVELAGRSAPLLRVAFHPADVHGARPLPYIISRLRTLMRGRRLVSYAEWL